MEWIVVHLLKIANAEITGYWYLYFEIARSRVYPKLYQFETSDQPIGGLLSMSPYIPEIYLCWILFLEFEILVRPEKCKILETDIASFPPRTSSI